MAMCSMVSCGGCGRCSDANEPDDMELDTNRPTTEPTDEEIEAKLAHLELVEGWRTLASGDTETIADLIVADICAYGCGRPVDPSYAPFCGPYCAIDAEVL